MALLLFRSTGETRDESWMAGGGNSKASWRDESWELPSLPLMSEEEPGVGGRAVRGIGESGCVAEVCIVGIFVFGEQKGMEEEGCVSRDWEGDLKITFFFSL